MKEFILIGMGMALIWYGTRFFISREISKRIQGLREVMNAVSKGNVTKRAPEEASDEISRLAKDLNAMIESLIEARQLPENILRSMKEGLFVVDIKGNISEVNQAALDMLGYAKEELVGKSITTIFINK